MFGVEGDASFCSFRMKNRYNYIPHCRLIVTITQDQVGGGFHPNTPRSAGGGGEKSLILRGAILTPPETSFYADFSELLFVSIALTLVEISVNCDRS